MSRLDSVVVDADNHYYETSDSFSRHLDPALAHLGVRSVRENDLEQIMVGSRRFSYLAPTPGRSIFECVPAGPPGSLREKLQRVVSGSIDGFYDERATEEMRPEYVNREARLALMDRQGIDACLMLPSLGVTVEHFMKDDPVQTYANLRAFNRWLDEDWGFAYQERIFSVPLLSLIDVDAAVAELEWVLERGARVVHLRAGPAFGRSPADPFFDPFWARVNESGAVVAYHSAESGYNELYGAHWGEDPNPACHYQSAFQWVNFFGDRPIMETISALILHNLFGRFPNIRVASVENGSVWVPYLLKVMDKMKGMGRSGPWLGGYVKGRPSDVFREHVFVSPYHEEDIASLVGVTGADCLLFGSDFPHPEGLAEPLSYRKALEGLPDEAVRKIMGENACRLLGLKVPSPSA